jgi:hypothetical protein
MVPLLQPIHRRISFVLLLLLVVAHHRCTARTCTSTDNGDWIAAGSWSCGSAPAAGDTLIIQAGHTVTVHANHTYTGTPIRVQVYGTLFFNGGGAKLSFPCGSIVEVMTPSATITGNNSGSSQTIKICGTTFWAVSNGPVSGYTAWPIGSTLPVELLFYTTEAQGNEVFCEWATATERNSDRFELFRSRDGATKELVDSQPAAGNSTTRIDYRAVDRLVPTGLWYYSLRQIDSDGTEEELGTNVVQVNASGPILWPNPVSEGPVVVQWQGNVTSIRLIDVMGREFTPVIRSVSADHFEIGISDLPSGIYGVRVGDTSLGGARFQKL